MTRENEDQKKSLMALYVKRKTLIRDRLMEFRRKMHSSDDEIFSELVFCIFTPQSSAKTCDRAVRRLEEKNLLKSGSSTSIAKEMAGVRFHKTKSERVVCARNMFMEGNRLAIKKILNSHGSSTELREWLRKNVCGLGYKESSHFLRNIGQGDSMAILDRHILGNLARLGVIDRIPKSISKSTYMSIEQKMVGFSKTLGISVAELDLLLWSKETGEVFK